MPKIDLHELLGILIAFPLQGYQQYQQFNPTVGGRLIALTPLAIEKGPSPSPLDAPRMLGDFRPDLLIAYQLLRIPHKGKNTGRRGRCATSVPRSGGFRSDRKRLSISVFNNLAEKGANRA